MTGGHVQGDLLAPEDVVSLLLDDAQLEQKLRDLPLQVQFKSIFMSIQLIVILSLICLYVFDSLSFYFYLFSYCSPEG